MARLSPVPRRDVAVDVGTGSTRLYSRGRGVILEEPSVVSFRPENGMIVAIGQGAAEMRGRSPAGISTVNPMEAGSVADYELALHMLRYFLHSSRRRFSYTGLRRVVTCVPTDATAVQRRALAQALTKAGTREVRILDQPMAAALGAGVQVLTQSGHLVVDIGYGKTETAVIASGSIISAASSPVGGAALDTAIRRHVREHHAVSISERAAEALKCLVGADGDLDMVQVRGQDVSGGLPHTRQLPAAELSEAMRPGLSAIAGTVRTALDRCPSELVLDIADQGIILTGGGSLLRGMEDFLRRETHLPVHVVDDPAMAVARGCGHCVDDFSAYRPLFPEAVRPRSR
jgi:rod shape-determining protein MreB